MNLRITQWTFVIVAALTSNSSHSEALRVQVKSFIRHMESAESAKGGAVSDATKKALGFDSWVGGRTHALIFMRQTDGMFSENPSTGDVGGGQFRLWSQVTADVVCKGNSVAGATFQPLQTAFGKEGPLESVGQVVKPLTSTKDSKQATFSYRIKGRPNNASIPAFDFIKPRSCTWIWHEVNGVIRCTGGKAVTEVNLKHSAFPSHRVWVNGTRVHDIAQGPFENLWICDPADRTLVR